MLLLLDAVHTVSRGPRSRQLMFSIMVWLVHARHHDPSPPALALPLDRESLSQMLLGRVYGV